jgi:beta-lactamase superfamily II metal-dependent hydrolase
VERWVIHRLLSNIGEPPFADTQIDYLIVPHHGSEHTDYGKIVDNNVVAKKGIMAIISCTNESTINRPNTQHRNELEKRFDNNVFTTEDVKSLKIGTDVSITIEFSDSELNT